MRQCRHDSVPVTLGYSFQGTLALYPRTNTPLRPLLAVTRVPPVPFIFRLRAELRARFDQGEHDKR